jgi:hypothetical protein
MRGSGDGQGELAEQGGQGKEGTKTKKAQNSDCPVHRKRRTTATNINSAALTGGHCASTAEIGASRPLRDREMRHAAQCGAHMAPHDLQFPQ